MKISRNQLRAIIKEALLLEEKEDVDFDPGGLGSLNIPPKLLKMLDPDIPPAKYSQMDAELDASGTPNQQAFALAAFALSYADGEEAGSSTVLKKAIGLIPKIITAQEEKKDTGEEDKGDDGVFEME
jgi:hypothetical protein